MLVAMTKVQMVGRKGHIEPVLGRLYRMGLLELVSALEEPALELASFPGGDERAERGHEQHLMLAQLEGLLTLAGRLGREHAGPSRRRRWTTSGAS
jgi:hypothetical protein